ncbi:MFS transporter [Sediminimonas qiaohouensis]|uniref:MFS transporter n=1 Tax=Sediminimonas qiaohouensis TaxID=552061 RepID=UPI001B7FBBF9|nr:MFS transporter [Sediminimonas qiaohouensis]
MFAINQLDRNILAITLDQIGTEFALTDTQPGLLSGAMFVLVYVLIGFPVARLAAHRNRRNILSAAGANIGVLFAFLVGAIAGQALGWRWTFVIVGLPGVLLALLLRFTVAEPHRADAGTPARQGSLFLLTWRTIRNDAGLFHAMCGLAVTGIVTFGALTWNATFIIRAHDLSQAQTGIYLALIVGILGGLGTWAGGAIADRLGADTSR